MKASDGIRPAGLRCEFLDGPCTIDTRQPRLSWTLDGIGWQTGCQVLVATRPELLAQSCGDLWDSGRIETPDMAVAYRGKPLASRMSCHWAVRVWDRDGRPSGWSEPARWEMALLCPADWHAQWIARAEHDAGIPTCYSPILRRSFQLPAKPVSARLYSTGLGLADFFVNGRPPGDYILGTGLTDPARRVYYAADDVTDSLVQGENVLAAWLYSGSYNPNVLGVGHRVPVLLAQLEITCSDGSVHTVVSDASWRTAPSPVTPWNKHFTCDNGAQFYEAYRELDGWREPGCDDRLWLPAVEVEPPRGSLRVRMHAPTRIVGTARPITVDMPSPWQERYVFAESMTARIRLEVRGRYRGRLRVTCRDRAIDRAAHPHLRNEWNQVDEYRLRGLEDVRDQGAVEGIDHDLTTPFLYRGVQEVVIDKTYIEGNYQPRGVEVKSVVAEIVSDDVRRVGHFRCSEPLLNDIYEAMVRTQRALTHRGYFADCPAREDSPWLGGAVTCHTLLSFNHDLAAFFRKRIADIFDEQQTSGEIPPHAPLRSAFSEGSPSMAATCVHYPWHQFLFYADDTCVRTHLPGMRRWLEFIAGKFHDGIVQPFRAYYSPRPHEIYRYGDPCAHGDSRVWDPGEMGLYNTLEILLAVRRFCELADRLGRPEWAREWSEFFESCRERIDAAHYDQHWGCYGLGTQGVQLFALLSHIAQGQRRHRVLESLSRDILLTRKGTAGTGWHATNMFFELLAREDMAEEAHALLTCEQVPSWGAFIRAGCTTIPEDWHVPCSSNIHSVFLGAGSWFYEGYAGIQADADHPGFEQFAVRPQIPRRGLEWVEASYQSARGPIRSAWQCSGGRVTMELTVPANAVASIQVPTAQHEAVAVTAQDDAAPAVEAACVRGRPAFRAGPGTHRFQWAEP